MAYEHPLVVPSNSVSRNPRLNIKQPNVTSLGQGNTPIKTTVTSFQVRTPSGRVVYIPRN